MDSDKLIDFMRRLVHDSTKKVFLILDNLRVHHSTVSFSDTADVIAVSGVSEAVQAVMPNTIASAADNIIILFLSMLAHSY